MVGEENADIVSQKLHNLVGQGHIARPEGAGKNPPNAEVGIGIAKQGGVHTAPGDHTDGTAHSLRKIRRF